MLLRKENKELIFPLEQGLVNASVQRREKLFLSNSLTSFTGSQYREDFINSCK